MQGGHIPECRVTEGRFAFLEETEILLGKIVEDTVAPI